MTAREPLPECKDTRPCFARTADLRCKALSETYAINGACPFCKSPEVRSLELKREAMRENPYRDISHPDIVII